MRGRALRGFFTSSFTKGLSIYWTLLSITVPLLIAVRLLEEHFDIIAHTGALLTPFMGLVGLPGDAAIVLATAFFLHIYGALLVLATLWHDLNLTTAQSTILMTMMLIAHALPVELRIVQKAGMPASAALLLRLGGAFALGALLHLAYGDTYLQQPAVLAFVPAAAAHGWGDWARQQLINWGVIFFIVQALMLFVNLMRVTHAERLLIWLLSPLFRHMGIGDKAINMTMIGMLIGLSYGGGLLIAEARKGTIARRDVLCALSLLCLCHSIVEDTLIGLLIGAHLSGILFARVGFSIAVMAVLNLLLRRTMPAEAKA